MWCIFAHHNSFQPRENLGSSVQIKNRKSHNNMTQMKQSTLTQTSPSSGGSMYHNRLFGKVLWITDAFQKSEGSCFFNLFFALQYFLNTDNMPREWETNPQKKFCDLAGLQTQDHPNNSQKLLPLSHLDRLLAVEKYKLHKQHCLEAIAKFQLIFTRSWAEMEHRLKYVTLMPSQWTYCGIFLSLLVAK